MNHCALSSIYLKGRQLAVIASQGGYGVIFDDYVVSGLSVEISDHEIIGYGFPSYSMPGQITASVDIRSHGKVTTFDADQIKREFGPPEDLTIEELLKIVYRKIDERETNGD